MGEREACSILSRGEGGVHNFYVHVAVGGHTFSIINFRERGGVVHWGGRGTAESVGAGAGCRASALYVVGIIFWPSRGSVGDHTCSEIIEKEKNMKVYLLN